MKPYRFEYSPHTLPKPIQETLPKFEEIARLTEELKLLQMDPSGVKLWDRFGFGYHIWLPHVETPGPGTISIEFFERGYEGGCNRYVQDPFCEPVNTFPDLDPNTTMWPDDIKASLKTSDLGNL